MLRGEVGCACVAHTDVANNQKVENGAALVAKYKGIRFFDAGIEGGTYYRVRSDQCTWAGKRAGGWLATCSEMPSSGPSEDAVKRPLRGPRGRRGALRRARPGGVRDQRGTIVEVDQAAGIIMEADEEEEEEE